jgi:hypothetical protein
MCAQTLKCKNCGQSFYETLIPPLSPVPSRLASNSIPSNAEAADIRSALLGADRDLLEINKDIDILEALLEKRRLERQAFEDFRNAHNGLLSSIRKLPMELLSEVFLNVLECERPQKGVLYEAFALGAVCSHWRTVALSTPGLWCKIFVNVFEGNADSKADMVQTWIERSAQYPLSITLNSDEENSSHSVIDLIVNHCHRLRFFDVSLTHTTFRCLAPLKSRLPMLQTLCLHIYYAIREDLRLFSCDAFVDAPQLRVLDTSCPPGMFILPFKQITRFFTSKLSITYCIEILAMAPNVEACTLDRILFGLYLLRPPVVSHMQSLCITEADCYGLERLFVTLTLPSVLEISIENVRGSGYYWLTEFMALLSRSLCPLRRLVLSQTQDGISGGDLISCLELTPSLEELEIRSMAPSSEADPTHAHPIDVVLQALTHRAGSSAQQTLLPSLHTLRFWGDSEFDESIFLSMVESRWLGSLPTGLTRLRCVAVDLEIYDTARDLMPQTWDRVKEWRNQGLNIKLSLTVRGNISN